MDAENIEMASMGNGEEDAKQPLLSRRRAKLKKNGSTSKSAMTKKEGRAASVLVANATSLLLACKNGRDDEARQLLEANNPALSSEDINKEDDNGETALTLAITSNMTNVALCLMHRGARCDLRNNHRTTPLSLACRLGLTEVVDELLKDLEEGGPGLSAEHINIANENGETALTLATCSKMSDVALRLMKRGANCDVITSNNTTPLSLACWKGLGEVAMEVLKGSEEGHINTVTLSSSADENGVQPGNTALTLAIASKMSDVALRLIKKGAKCDIVANSGETPLNLACLYGLTEVAVELLKDAKVCNKEHINIGSKNGRIALIDAINEHMLEVMKILLDQGAECVDTPLYEACRASFQDGALYLLAQEKYDINKPGEDGKTPLEWAVKNNLSGVVLKLQMQGARLVKNNKKVLEIKPNDLQAYLDELVTVDKPERKSARKSQEKLVLNYSFLTRYGEDQTPLLNSVLNLSTKHRELVKHPLVRAFLMMKWEKMKIIWAFWIILKLLFLLCFISFAVVILSSNQHGTIVNEICATMTNPLKMDTEQIYEQGAEENYELSLNTTEKDRNFSEDDEDVVKNGTRPVKRLKDRSSTEETKRKVDWNATEIHSSSAAFRKTCKEMANPLKMDTNKPLILSFQIVFVVLLAIFSVIEIGQFVSSIKAWPSELKNWLQAVILGCSIFLCVAMFLGTYYQESKHVIAFLLLMVCYETLYQVGYHYKFAKYINLFNRVLKTFFEYFLAYMPMILCFALGYAVMLPAPEPENSDDFPDTFWGLLPKVFVMVTGEQEYMNIPFSNSMTFRILEVLYYLIFLMLTVVILLNLLTGLAVADAKEMLDASETDSLCTILKTAAFWDVKFMKENKETRLEEDKDLEVDIPPSSPAPPATPAPPAPLLTAWCSCCTVLRDFMTKLKTNFFVLKSDSPKYFFYVYEGETDRYKAYNGGLGSAYDEIRDFTIDKELKEMAIQIIHTRNLAEQERKEREEEQKEREEENKIRKLLLVQLTSNSNSIPK